MFRTRQAPSPTGFLHLGTARTVLFTKLFAMINDGVYYLRIEDTDRSRLVQDSVRILLNALEAIGLSPDEGVTLVKTTADQKPDEFYGIYQKGGYGPYVQSQRKDLYLQKAQELIDRDLAYWDFLDSKDIQELQDIKQATKQTINYYQANLEKIQKLGLPLESLTISVKENYTAEKPQPLRYRLMRDQKILCQDELLGQTEFDLKLEEDFIILKNDGFPTYHLAHIVDDYQMKTSLVIRSQEWYPSIAKHITMFKDFYGIECVPKYLHLPFILGEVGNKKMSKRDGSVNLQSYLDRGYLPEALVNYLAFLGWNPGTDKEMYF
jgi:nondiscriminating glutamyl-tRNA synthetase